LYAVEDIPAGGQITESNVHSIRPGGGLPPGNLPDLINKITKQAVKKGTPITRDVCHP